MKLLGKTITQVVALAFLIALSLGINYLSAWTGPTALPPNNNIAAPLNTTNTAQVKNGNISVGASANTTSNVGLTVYGSQSTNGTVYGHGNAGGVIGNGVYGISGGTGGHGVVGAGPNDSSAYGVIGIGSATSTYYGALGRADGYSFVGNGTLYNGGNIYTPTGELQSTLTGTANVRMVGGTIGAMLRNDGASTYILLTAPNNPWGGWNALRPLYINDTTGMVNLDNGVTVRGPGVTFPDGTVQTTASGGKGTLVTQVVTGTYNCANNVTASASCPSGWAPLSCQAGATLSGNTCSVSSGSSAYTCMSTTIACGQIQ
jgi:hypothetical protein